MEKFELTDEEIAHVLTLTPEEITRMIYNMDYDDFYPYMNSFNKIYYDRFLKCNDFRYIDEECRKIGGELVLSADKKAEWDKYEEEYNIYYAVNKIIQTTILNKKASCSHSYELYGCRGYDREIDVYRCKHCGHEIEK